MGKFNVHFMQVFTLVQSQNTLNDGIENVKHHAVIFLCLLCTGKLLPSLLLDLNAAVFFYFLCL